MFSVFSGHPVAPRLSFGHVAPWDEQPHASRVATHRARVRLLAVEQGRRRRPCRSALCAAALAQPSEPSPSRVWVRAAVSLRCPTVPPLSGRPGP